MGKELVQFQDVVEAAERIRPFVHRTPVITSATLNEQLCAHIFLKCENLQRAGAFKIRGATNAVLQLTAAERERGVVTHSSGNHGQALALAAKLRGMKATVIMPSTSSRVKRESVALYGAEVRLCEPTLAAREATTRDVIEQTGAVLIHPYNDERIIAGQGTAALELLDQVDELDAIITPVGGGGLLSGSALALSGKGRSITIFAGEPKGADDAARSLKAGKLLPADEPKSIADGLLASLGEKPFSVIRERVQEIYTVSEEAIISAMRFVWERTKLIIEPSSAVAVAVLFENPEVFRGKRVGVILSGGNVDLERLPWGQM